MNDNYSLDFNLAAGLKPFSDMSGPFTGPGEQVIQCQCHVNYTRNSERHCLSLLSSPFSASRLSGAMFMGK